MINPTIRDTLSAHVCPPPHDPSHLPCMYRLFAYTWGAGRGNPRAARYGGGMESARKREALELFYALARRYDRLSAALSFWQDPRWRRALVDAVAPQAGERILDVATGTGMVAAELRARADCTVVGLDQSPQMLATARARFAGEGARVELVEGEAERLPFEDASFDALTFTYLLRYVEDPLATIRELTRVVRPGGRVASLEFGVPPRRLPREAWRLYTAIGLPTLGRVASREWAEVGRFLRAAFGDSTRSTRWSGSSATRGMRSWTMCGCGG